MILKEVACSAHVGGEVAVEFYFVGEDEVFDVCLIDAGLGADQFGDSVDELGECHGYVDCCSCFALFVDRSVRTLFVFWSTVL